MAGAASGEEENYWPGYVDALTTMLMVLTFVMMVLGIVVFTLSQNVSKNVVAAVAQAVDIDTSSLDARTPDALRQAVIEALKKKLAHSAPWASATTPPASSPTAEHRAAPSPPAPSLPTFASGAATLPPSPSPKPDEASAPAAAQVASLPPSSDLELQGAGRDQIIESDTPPTETPRERPPSVAEAGEGLKIVYRNGAVQLDAAGAAALQDYARQFGTGSLIVRASAFVSSTGATEARRRAYYRAMLVRERIVKIGLPASQIVVEVRDDAASDAQDLVYVIGRNKGVK